MKYFGMLWVCVLFQAGVLAAAEEREEGWKTSRSEKFGYELSYPPEMRYTEYFNGSSGNLVKADTVESLVYFEVWPPSECSVSKKERTGAIARDVGIQRARDVTQADGQGSSSYCGDPVSVRGGTSRYGTRTYELELTCVNEEYPGAGDEEANQEPDKVSVDQRAIITAAGKKGPTFFADISQSWLKRVLMADPVGVDPRQNGKKSTGASDVLRKVLATLKTFPVPKPAGNCIQDFSETAP